MYSQILLKLHLKYKVTLGPVIVHYEVMSYSNGENLSDVAAKMSNSESLNYFNFLILNLFLNFFIEEAVAVLGNKIVEDLRTQDPDEGIE